MAALIRHGLLKGGQAINTSENVFMIRSNYLNTNIKKVFKPSYKMPYNRKKQKVPQPILFDSTRESIAAKGFHRSQKPYYPPDDVADRLQSLYAAEIGSTDKTLDTPEVKFKFLNACFQELKHSVPNSQLSSMKSLDDVIEFYQNPVEKSQPLDALKSMKLPENLHIQTEPLRFHPETDTMFNGVSAFPKSSTIVTGLRYKKKYKGYRAEGIKGSWPL